MAGRNHTGHETYRAYNSDGQCLYVGMSSNALRRVTDHAYLSGWYGEVSRIEIDRHDSHESALAHEKLLIASAQPRWNVQHGADPVVRRSARKRRLESLKEKLASEPGEWVKHFPHFDEVIMRMDRLFDLKLALYFVDRAIAQGTTRFRMDDGRKASIMQRFGVSKASVQNAITRLAEPVELGGVEILVKLERGHYIINPRFYFVGREPEHDNALDLYHKLKRERAPAIKARKAAREKRKARPKKATVTKLRSVGSPSSGASLPP